LPGCCAAPASGARQRQRARVTRSPILRCSMGGS
jgi:hypothetical protein